VPIGLQLLQDILATSSGVVAATAMRSHPAIIQPQMSGTKRLADHGRVAQFMSLNGLKRRTRDNCSSN
jgi:hypothetical protein